MMLSRTGLIAALIVAVAMLGVASLAVGRVWLPWQVWFGAVDDPRWAIIAALRIPRTILAIAVGVALGLSGACLQGYTRNPLADPAVLGVSSMAALGAVLTLYYGTADSAGWITPVTAIIGALAGVALLLMLAGGGSGMVAFILAGTVLNVVAGAGVSLALSLAPNPWAVSEIVDWLMGSIQDRSAQDAWLAVPFIATGCVMMATTGRALDALTLGEMGARSLGISLARTQMLIALGVGLAAGASVAATGVIGFVGLVTPHLLRPLVGERPGALLVPSALGGAVLLLAADIAVRLLPTVGEVRLGVVTAALGGPFFLWLLLSMKRRIA